MALSEHDQHVLADLEQQFDAERRQDKHLDRRRFVGSLAAWLVGMYLVLAALSGGPAGAAALIVLGVVAVVAATTAHRRAGSRSGSTLRPIERHR